MFGLQRCEAIAEDVGLNALLIGDPDFSDRYVRNIQGVTAEDVRRVARTYLDPERLCVSRVVPQDRAAAGEEREAEGKPAAGKAEGRPEIVARTLSN
ncbi:MAG: hypothetical protein R6X20_00420, partial [Phycisphaerae bacterium]